ncbi:MAG: hypothetical protein OXM55_01700 [Bdellovibrionales bacterium]|nr:hypothetical protein [Bdellovibrionales bacterium]
MKKIVFILSSLLLVSSAEVYSRDYTGKYQPVLELQSSQKKEGIKISQMNHHLYNDVYNITLPALYYYPERRDGDQQVCQQILAKLQANIAECRRQYPINTSENYRECRNRAIAKYNRKNLPQCHAGQSFSFFVNVLTAKGKIKKYKESPETAPIASVDWIVYDNGEQSISSSNAGYVKTSRNTMGSTNLWDPLIRQNYKNYYCIWARISLPTRDSYMEHMSWLLVDFQKKVADGNITLPGDFTSNSDYNTWNKSLGSLSSPRRIRVTNKTTECNEKATARTKDYRPPFSSISELLLRCTFPTASKLRRQFIVEDFMASKGFYHQSKYFKDDEVVPIYLRIVREGNLVCRTNPWRSDSYLRDFPLSTNL